MKKFLTILISIFVLASCGDSVNKTDGSSLDLNKSANEGFYSSIFGKNIPLSSIGDGFSTKRVVKIGLLLPLSGKASRLGQSMQDAATLALWDQYSALSPSDAKRVQVIILPKDTKGTMDGAENAAREAINDGVNIILGPLYSSSVTAVSPIAKENGIQMITFSNNKSVAGDGVFVMGFQPDEQIKRVVEYSASQGRANFASLTPNDAYGEMVKNALRETADITDINIKMQRSYGADKSRYARPIRDLLDFDEKKYTKNLKENENSDENEVFGERYYDALLIPEGGMKLLDIAKLLDYYHFDKEKVKLIGSGQWDNPEILQASVLHGGWFATSPPDRKIAFLNNFEKQFQYKPQRLASLSYDAMSLAVVLSFMNEFSSEALTDPVGFNAPADGLFRFNKNGVAERKLAVLELTEDGFVVIDPAPDSFDY